MTTSCQWRTEEREPIAPEVHGNMYTRYMDTKSLRFRALPSASERIETKVLYFTPIFNQHVHKK